MIWQILDWMANNPEIVLGAIGFISVLVKQRYDNNQHKNAREADRIESEKARQTHMQDLERRAAEDNTKQREWFRQQLDTQDKKMEKLEDRERELVRKLGDVTIENSLRKGTIESLQHEIKELRKQLSDLREELHQYQIENGQLIKENSKLSTQYHEEKERNAILETLNRTHLEKIASLSTQVKELDTQLRIAESTISGQAETMKTLSKDDDTRDIPVLDDDGNPALATPDAKASDSNENDNPKKKDIA